MRNIVFLFFIETLAVIEASKSRSVNVAVETVLEFDGKDDVAFIDTLQKFLGKLKTTITRHRTNNSQDSKHLDDLKEENDKHFIFTDFLAETVSVLKSYEDDDLKKFFRTLDRELKKWETRKEFHDITDKLGFRRLVGGKLKTVKNFPVDEIRRKLNSLSEKLTAANKRDGSKGFVGDVLNNFYKRESKTKLLNFLNNLKLYRFKRRRNLLDLKNIIRNGILTIIDPFLNLNTDSLPDINSFYYKYVANYSDPKIIEKYVFNNVLKNDSKPLRTPHRDKSHKVTKEHELLDYIEDHKRIIEEHFTAKGVIVKTKRKSKPKAFKTTGTIYKHIPATRSKTKKEIKAKHSDMGRAIINPYEIVYKYATKKVKNRNKSNDRKPVLIKLGSSEDKELRSVEEYVFSTSKQPTKQKRYKKSTRRKVTTDKRNILKKTTKKSRKAFRTSTFSAEGLSIEHFGSLFGREFHRDSNDTFIPTVNNSTISTAPPDITLLRNGSDILKNKRRRKGDLSVETVEYYLEKHDDIKNISDSVEGSTTSVTDTLIMDNNLMKESIQIRGNIIIENPTETTLDKIERTTPMSVYDSTTGRHFNVSIVTKYVNFENVEPKLNLRRQDTEIPDKLLLTKTPTAMQTTIITPQIKSISIINSEIRTMDTTAAGDELENEIEEIMDKYNTSTIPVEYEKLMKEAENDDKENDKVKEQMKADFAKLMAPPSTKSTVPELFTDPFDGIDNDLL